MLTVLELISNKSGPTAPCRGDRPGPVSEHAESLASMTIPSTSFEHNELDMNVEDSASLVVDLGRGLYCLLR